MAASRALSLTLVFVCDHHPWWWRYVVHATQSPHMMNNASHHISSRSRVNEWWTRRVWCCVYEVCRYREIAKRGAADVSNYNDERVHTHSAQPAHFVVEGFVDICIVDLSWMECLHACLWSFLAFGQRAAGTLWFHENTQTHTRRNREHVVVNNDVMTASKCELYTRNILLRILCIRPS